ncbi:hypothetical protein D0T49_02070 [Paludibacter sp. 221]|uniref:hypothetical protein n=1 Tax=Paludibacter sp. 221 TaxID=2302939 RepID=UPI0013CF4934|nr:hypothetical protein [Paludibacter sp. 221]NDV45837.1 hypothetical protein [Paludibacter sp. 221]
MSKKKHQIDNNTFAEQEAEFQSCLERIIGGVQLPPREIQLFEQDVRKAVEYYISSSLTMEEAFERIGPDIFGTFYSEPDPNEWYPLDSAAKIYPLSMTRSNMSMYRISANMTKQVVPEILQLALHAVIKRFPTFATTLKRGVFWHYLDARRKRFTIEEEENQPCSPIKVNTNSDQVFRILYFNRRISIEVFHVVADGYGGMTLFKTLLNEYLRMLGEPTTVADDILDISEVPKPEESVNAFTLTDKSKNTSGYGNASALQISGKRTKIQPAQLLHFIMQSQDLIQTAKKHGTNVTGFVLSAMFLAVKSATKETKGTFQIQVPVNMRQYYPVRTLRNFSMYAIVKIPYENVVDMETLIPMINEQLKVGTSKESLDQMAAMTNKIVSNPGVKYMPIGLKGIVISRIIKYITRKSFTATLSNIGAVKTDFFGNIRSFEAILGPVNSNEVSCGLVSYEDSIVLSITKTVMESAFEAKLYEVFTSLGIDVVIEGNNL